MSSPLRRGGTLKHVSEEEEAPGMSEEEEPPVDIDEEEEPPPTSPQSRLSRRREEKQCGDGCTSHLLHTRGRRSGAMMTGASHLMERGMRSGVARGRSKSPIAISDLSLHELRVLANHGRSKVSKK
jgi:hypothetical protein